MTLRVLSTGACGGDGGDGAIGDLVSDPWDSVMVLLRLRRSATAGWMRLQGFLQVQTQTCAAPTHVRRTACTCSSTSQAHIFHSALGGTWARRRLLFLKIRRLFLFFGPTAVYKSVKTHLKACGRSQAGLAADSSADLGAALTSPPGLTFSTGRNLLN